MCSYGLNIFLVGGFDLHLSFLKHVHLARSSRLSKSCQFCRNCRSCVDNRAKLQLFCFLIDFVYPERAGIFFLSQSQIPFTISAFGRPLALSRIATVSMTCKNLPTHFIPPHVAPPPLHLDRVQRVGSFSPRLSSVCLATPSSVVVDDVVVFG